MTLYEFLKSIALIILFANITPFLIKNIKSHYSYFLEQYTYIGILHIKGYISDSSAYTKDLLTFFKDPFIKGIILKIDCYECAAGTSQAISNDIQQLKKEYPKPIITFVENTCVSGAYLIASASDYIIAPEHAIIGGIGSYTYPATLKQMFFLCGLKNTPQHVEKENNQAHNNLAHEIYQQFTKYVATTRKLSLATVSNWAHEKLFTGKQACNIGLINAIGSMHTVITLLKEKALIDGEIEWIEKEHTNYRHLLYHLVKLAYNNSMNENLKVV